jgi:hypothetical protein
MASLAIMCLARYFKPIFIDSEHLSQLLQKMVNICIGNKILAASNQHLRYLNLF